MKAVVALRFGCAFLILAVISVCNPSFAAATTSTQEHHLRLYHTHTGEHIDIVYRRGDVYLPEAEEELDHFLRDHRTGDVRHCDPRLFDILSDLTAAVGHPGVETEIICGYRTAWSNEFLRARSAGVAKNSLHMQAHAIDIRIPGVDTLTLRNAALALGRGEWVITPARDSFMWTRDASVRGVSVAPRRAPMLNSLCKREQPRLNVPEG